MSSNGSVQGVLIHGTGSGTFAGGCNNLSFNACGVSKNSGVSASDGFQVIGVPVPLPVQRIYSSWNVFQIKIHHLVQPVMALISKIILIIRGISAQVRLTLPLVSCLPMLQTRLLSSVKLLAMAQMVLIL